MSRFLLGNGPHDQRLVPPRFCPPKNEYLCTNMTVCDYLVISFRSLFLPIKNQNGYDLQFVHYFGFGYSHKL